MTGPVLVVAGPTASGKSSLALAVAEAFRGVVINADSMQVYRELRVLTARPDEAATARIPHRLYGVISGREACSAARWRALALKEIEAAHEAGRIPLVTGGSGLYLAALMEGLSDIPDVPEEVRRAARARHARLGGPKFHAELARRDPATAARLNPGDTQRLIRAWEVLEATGRPLTHWQAGATMAPPAGLKFLPLVLMPPRRNLYAACDARFRHMVAQGAVAEVEALLALRLDPDLPIMRALGVRELAAHVRGETTLDEAVERAQRATRRYAKRQMTWFRSRMPGAAVVGAQFSESLKEEIFPIIRQFMLTAYV